LAGKFGLIGAAASGGWKVGTWIRDFTGLGKVLDRLIVPAKEVSNSIADIVKKRTDGLNASLAATRTNLKEIAGAADKAAQAFVALNEKEAAGVDLGVQQGIAKLRAGAEALPEQERKEQAPVLQAKEQELVAQGRFKQAELAVSSAQKTEEANQKALQSTRSEIKKTEQDLVKYNKAKEEAERLGRLVAPEARAGSLGSQKELSTQLANLKTAQTQIDTAKEHLKELKSLETDQALALTKSEAASKRAVAGVAAAENESKAAAQGVVDAQAEVQKEKDEKRQKHAEEVQGVKEEIAENAKQRDKAALDQRWRKELAKSQKEGAKLQNALETREAMGEPGTPEFREARKQERKEEARERRRRDRLESLGIKIGADGLITESVDTIEKRLAKQGRKLSPEEIERLRRDELRSKLGLEEMNQGVIQANIEGAEDAAIAKWRDDMLLSSQALEDKLAKLLQSAPG
jgi:hypothetical protein